MLFCHAPPRARVYEFNAQLRIGRLAEDTVDRVVAPIFNSRPAPKEFDYHRGVDRFWYDRNGLCLAAQVKLDCATHRTQNVFLELALRDSRADVFAYLLPGLQRLIVFVADAILSNLDGWVDRYGLRMVENRGYASPGVPVPLNDLLPLAWFLFPLDETQLPCHQCVWSMPRDVAEPLARQTT